MQGGYLVKAFSAPVESLTLVDSLTRSPKLFSLLSGLDWVVTVIGDLLNSQKCRRLTALTLAALTDCLFPLDLWQKSLNDGMPSPESGLGFRTSP